jgi:type I restriction enzyme S subunit
MSDWQRTTLGAFVSLQRGHDLPDRERRPGRVPVIGSGGHVGWHDASMVRGPGVTIGRAANLGVPTLTDDDFWPLNTTLYVTDFHGNDVWFTYYLLKTLDLSGFNSGSVQPMLNRNYVRDFALTVPEPKEQATIAAVLRALDEKVAANESGIRTANNLMRIHFRQAIEKGSTTVTIGTVATAFDGPHATPVKTISGPWFLSISSLQDGRLVLNESAHLAEQDFVRWTRRVTPMAGDVLFSYETRLGEAALMPDGVRACLGRRMALLRPHTDVVGPRTLLQAYLGESFQETIRQRAVHGATVDRIPLTELPTWPIAVPERAGRLESLLGAIDDMAAQRERENETLAALHETLLPKLMSGKIRVRDAAKVLEEAL